MITPRVRNWEGMGQKEKWCNYKGGVKPCHGKALKRNGSSRSPQLSQGSWAFLSPHWLVFEHGLLLMRGLSCGWDRFFLGRDSTGSHNPAVLLWTFQGMKIFILKGVLVTLHSFLLHWHFFYNIFKLLFNRKSFIQFYIPYLKHNYLYSLYYYVCCFVSVKWHIFWTL